MRLLAVLIAVFLAAGAATQDIQESVAHSFLQLERGGQALRLPWIRSHPLDQPQPGITRVVVCIHGTLRNANEYHPALIDAVELAGDEVDSTLVITPQFLTDADTQHHQLVDVLCWQYYGWRQGDRSVPGYGGPRPWDISSFAVIDSLFLRAADACPDLRDIVLVGHSAGGQAVNRWSATSPVPDRLRTERGVQFRSVVMNPSSYLYFSAERREAGTENVFSVPTPAQIAACPGYDDYKYGLGHPNEYADQHPDSLRSRYARRRVAHLAGELDCDPGDDYLDLTCPAQWQGSERLQRCRIYWNYLQWSFGDALSAWQAMAVVPGVGHDYRGMFTSPCGVHHLFDVGQCGQGPSATIDAPAARLGPPYPNPFNPRVTVPLTLDRTAEVTIAVYDPAGRRVRLLANGPRAAGAHRIVWHGIDDAGRRVPSGVYFVRIASSGRAALVAATLVR